LPFAFTLVLLGNSTPLFAALQNAGRCADPAPSEGKMRFAHAEMFLPGMLQPPPGLDSEERDYMIRTIAFEAGGETEQGMVAVAHVILNRARIGRWGDNIKEVVTSPWQFEPWMTRRSQMESLASHDARYRSAARITDGVLSGEMPDPTAGATHFLNPVLVRARRGGSLPKWAEGEGLPIGRHTFYMLEGIVGVPDADWHYLRIKANPSSC
jgi:spore germination cell wall hydrolase CwlJ-like protein